MTTVIEDNFIELQRKTTHALVQQIVIISKKEIIDNFLDSYNESKRNLAKLSCDYHFLMENVVKYLSESKSVTELTTVSEFINNLVDTTKRLVKALEKKRSANLKEVIEFKLLLSDIHEVLMDIQDRLTPNNGLSDLLNTI